MTVIPAIRMECFTAPPRQRKGANNMRPRAPSARPPRSRGLIQAQPMSDRHWQASFKACDPGARSPRRGGACATWAAWSFSALPAAIHYTNSTDPYCGATRAQRVATLALALCAGEAAMCMARDHTNIVFDELSDAGARQRPPRPLPGTTTRVASPAGDAARLHKSKSGLCGLQHNTPDRNSISKI